MENKYSFNHFIPLIIIFLVIITLTIAKQIVSPVWGIYSFMNDFMGIFFIIFGSFKIINLNHFAEAYASYDLVAKQSRLYALMYPFIELTLGIGYLIHFNVKLINWITLIIMIISAAGVARALSKQEEIECACLGMVFKIPMTYVTLGEDLLMAIMAGFMIIT